MRKALLPLLCLLFVPSLLGWSEKPSSLEKSAIWHQGQEREYLIHRPHTHTTSTQTPLVLFLHGGGGNATQAAKMGFNEVANRYGFIVAYPNALDTHWNDGRESRLLKSTTGEIDDSGFLVKVVQDISKHHPIDKNRVFTAGISNGGFMSQRLAIEHSEVFAAVGSIVSSLALPLKQKFSPRVPVSVLFMNGTRDPLVPYEGGKIEIRLFPRLTKLFGVKPIDRGECLSTDEAISLWLQHNGIAIQSVSQNRIANNNIEDDSSVDYFLWQRGQQGTAVALYRVNGGGHTIPGGKQYLPKRLIGVVNKDFDGLDAIWKFFVEHGRDPISPATP